MKRRTKSIISLLLLVVMLLGLAFPSSAAVTKAAFANYAYSKIGVPKSNFPVVSDSSWCTWFVTYCALQSGFKTTNAAASMLTNYNYNTVRVICAEPQKGDTAYIKYGGLEHWGIIYSCTYSTMVIVEASAVSYQGGGRDGPPQKVTYKWKPTTTYTPGAPNGYYRRDDGADCYVYRYKKN